MNNFNVLRTKMVEQQLISRGIRDKRTLDIFRKVPRELFVDDKYLDNSYEDHPLPIGNGQTISQPYIVALMTESLLLSPADKVLEIGTGSGYQTAILAMMCREVYSIERFPELAKKAQKVLGDLEIKNVTVKIADGSIGWEEQAPFDAILAGASAPKVPEPLLEQLNENGRLVIPVGSMYSQTLLKLVKKGGVVERKEICGCVFVPMVGEYGWTNER
ncbi:MAG: protein-L-isoaspartate(D-aspartate) O-methyltransferase [Candidatus Omnitrophica bacterium]|nr:protein-L-isoaspartate(D-aspartate) O-methyltransferase [Candidatus Omnitrophota bacterium]